MEMVLLATDYCVLSGLYERDNIDEVQKISYTISIIYMCINSGKAGFDTAVPTQPTASREALMHNDIMELVLLGWQE